MDAEERPVGLVSLGDLARAAAHAGDPIHELEPVARTLTVICRPRVSRSMGADERLEETAHFA